MNRSTPGLPVHHQLQHIISKSNVRGVWNFLGSVSSQQKLEAMGRPALQPLDRPVSQPLEGPVLRLHVTAQFYSESKGKYILEAWGHANPKDTKRRETTGPILAPFFICFFSSRLGLAYVNWARQEYCLFYLRSSHSSPQTCLCSIFAGFSLPCLLATAIPDSFFLF